MNFKGFDISDLGVKRGSKNCWSSDQREMQKQVCILNMSNAQDLAVYKLLFSSETKASIEDVQAKMAFGG